MLVASSAQACSLGPCWAEPWAASRIICYPLYTALPGAYALVGMGTLFAGIVRAPLTSVLMIFETTHDYTVIVPLMISNMVSFLIASRIQPQPIYESLATQDGIHLPGAQNAQSVRSAARCSSNAARTKVVPAAMTVREAFESLRGSESRAWPITDERGVTGVNRVSSRPWRPTNLFGPRKDGRRKPGQAAGRQPSRHTSDDGCCRPAQHPSICTACTAVAHHQRARSAASDLIRAFRQVKAK